MTGWFGRPAADPRSRLAGAPRLPRGYKMDRIEGSDGRSYWQVRGPGWCWYHAQPGSALAHAWEHWAHFQDQGQK